MLPAVDIEPHSTRRAYLRLIGGLGILIAIAIGTPSLTDSLALFDWHDPADVAMVAPIALPAPAPARRRPAPIPIEAPTRPTPRPVAASVTDTESGPRASQPLMAEEVVQIDPATTPAGPLPETPAPSGIVLNRTPAEQQYRAAAKAAVAGDKQAAIEQLTNLLETHADHHQATQLLASLYIQQQLLSEARTLLEQALEGHPLHAPYARMLARLLISEKRHADAIAVLESSLPAAGQDAEYQALLAGLYHHTGRPLDAVRQYASALRLDAQQGEWWMGLGLSQQQLGNHEAALGAYRRAMRFPLGASVRAYINDRMQQLM